MLVRALEVTGVQADMDEIECVLANLRYQGTVSGVLSHGQRMLALSKVNAFPSLTPSA